MEEWSFLQGTVEAGEQLGSSQGEGEKGKTLLTDSDTAFDP